MDELNEFYVHTVVVETKSGTNGLGEPVAEFSDPIPCFIRNSTRLIRDQAGQHLIGATEITCNNQYSDLFTPDSDVYRVEGDARSRMGSVQLVDVASSGDLILPDHTTVTIV